MMKGLLLEGGFFSLQQLETVVGPLLGHTNTQKNLMISRQEAFDLSYLILLEEYTLQQEQN